MMSSTSVLVTSVSYDSPKYLRPFTQNCLVSAKVDCVILLQVSSDKLYLSVGCGQDFAKRYTAQAVFRVLAESLGAKVEVSRYFVKVLQIYPLYRKAQTSVRSRSTVNRCYLRFH